MTEKQVEIGNNMKRFENMNAGTGYLIVVIFWLAMFYITTLIQNG